MRNFDKILGLMDGLLDEANPRVLEVGCANGLFLKRAVRRGMVAEGLEPDPDPDIEDGGFVVRTGRFPEAMNGDARYDAIVFNDVFEHLPDPVAAISEAERRLEDGGLAVLNLPSSSGVVFRAARRFRRFGLAGCYRRLWQKGLPSPHVTYFNPDNLRLLAERHTRLRAVHTGRMAVLAREGLWDRIRSTWPLVPALAVYPAAWLATFVLGRMPPRRESGRVQEGAGA